MSHTALSNHENNGHRVSGTFNTYLNLTLNESSGILVFHLSHPTDLRFWGNISHDSPSWEPDPLMFIFVRPDGTAHAYDRGADAETSMEGYGAGVVHAGGPDGTAQLDNRNNATVAGLRTMKADSFNATEGWLVVLWHGQVNTVRFDTQWDNGTTITEVGRGPATYYTPRDFRGGVRAGVAPVATVHVGDSLTIDNEDAQLFGSIYVQRTGRAGVGNLTLETGTFRKEYDMTGVPTVTADPAVPRVYACPCWTTTRWLLATDDDITMRYTQVGDKLSFVYPLIGKLPAGTLPFTWSEQDESPKPPR